MANSHTKFRTNYIKFTDKNALDAYKEAVENAVVNDDPLTIHTREYTDHYEIMFGAYSGLLGYPVDADNTDCDEYDYDVFIKTLQRLLPENEALIITTIGDEKLKYVYGNCDIITKNDWVIMNLCDIALDKARDMLKDPEWTTNNDY